MALSKKKFAKIAVLVLKRKIEKEDGGVRLDPKTIKDSIKSGAKELGITKKEMAEFMATFIKRAYRKTMRALKSVK